MQGIQQWLPDFEKRRAFFGQVVRRFVPEQKPHADSESSAQVREYLELWEELLRMRSQPDNTSAAALRRAIERATAQGGASDDGCLKLLGEAERQLILLQTGDADAGGTDWEAIASDLGPEFEIVLRHSHRSTPRNTTTPRNTSQSELAPSEFPVVAYDHADEEEQLEALAEMFDFRTKDGHLETLRIPLPTPLHRGMDAYLASTPKEHSTLLEKLRDWTLRALNRKIFVFIAVIWILNLLGWVVLFGLCMLHISGIHPQDSENKWAQDV